MAKEKIFHPASDPFSDAGKACAKLWPLLPLQLVLVILQYATLALCVALLFGPFLAGHIGSIVQGLSHPDEYDWGPLATDVMATFGDPTWIAIFLGTTVLYCLWWSLLAAYSDGGINATFWARARAGSPFSLGTFFRTGAETLMPMLFFQTIYVLLASFFLVPWGLGLCFGMLIVAGFFQVSALLGLGALLVFGLAVLVSLGLWIAFGAYGFLWKAHILQRRGQKDAPESSFRLALEGMGSSGKRFRDDRFRVGIGLTVASLTYVVVSILTRVFFAILAHLPFVGSFFEVVDLVVAVGLVVLFITYMPALAVAYLHEGEG